MATDDADVACVLYDFIPDVDSCQAIVDFSKEPNDTIVAAYNFAVNRPTKDHLRSKHIRRLEASAFRFYHASKKNQTFIKTLHSNYNGTSLKGVQIFSRPKFSWVSVTFLVQRDSDQLSSVNGFFTRKLAEHLQHNFGARLVIEYSHDTRSASWCSIYFFHQPEITFFVRTQLL